MATSHRTGPELKEAREVAGLTQEQVALALGVDRGTVISWEGKAIVKAPKAERYLRVVSELANQRDAA